MVGGRSNDNGEEEGGILSFLDENTLEKLPLYDRAGLIDNGEIDANDPARRTPSGEWKIPKFVRFHTYDAGVGLSEIFWQHPYNYTPFMGHNSRVESWGMYPVSLYRLQLSGKCIPKPEVQFLNALKRRKVEQLKAMDLSDLLQSDYTLRIYLSYIYNPSDGVTHRFWRRVRVSGGLRLSVFSDKIIKPLFGWVRNLHAHAFHDHSDGAMFGPKDCNSIDMMHLDKSGLTYIADADWTIAHILSDEGDKMSYHYDFGDNWWHDIELEHVSPPSESTGAVVALGGAGCNPPDGNGLGTHAFADMLDKARSSIVERRKLIKKMFEAMNYSPVGASWPASAPPDFDFDHFDLEATQAAINVALDSPASLPYASKKIVHPLNMDAHKSSATASRIGQHPSQLKRGIAVAQTPVRPGSFIGDGKMFLEEGVNKSRIDRPTNTACASCGSPNDLMACAGCRRRFYCKRECQREHWKRTHRYECAEMSKKK
ncbi:hypothetical protein OBBRIDRAFT_735878 [Obba rivulosa]|uniref:MYND-type domain-containing protein n=1 Tax=Obba rivulosa TaxID=1052685 RepID=A0A8E2DGY4_9APHY|nr:hypothetical protein OBBRIDRAFT_735878 [Obba rivulosa]